MGLRDTYAYAIQTAKGKFKGSADERDGKLHFKGTVATEDEKNELWTAIKTIPTWKNDVVADIQVTGYITDRFKLLAGVAYTHSKYTNFPDATTYPGTGLPGDPVTVGTIDASGNPLVRAPKWTGTFTASYDQPVGSGNLRFFSNYYVTSGFNFDSPGQFRQKGYGLLSGRITYTPANKAYSVGVFGNNLTDTKYLTQILPFSGAILQTYGTPLTYGVELGFKF